MQGSGAVSAYGDFSSSGSERAAALCCKRLRTKPGQARLRHAVAPHFPHDFSAKLTFYRGADEQAAESARVTGLNE